MDRLQGQASEMQMSKVCALEERDLCELERLQEFAWTVNFRHNCRRLFVYIFAFNHTCLEPSLCVPLTYQKHRVSLSSTLRHFGGDKVSQCSWSSLAC